MLWERKLEKVTVLGTLECYDPWCPIGLMNPVQAAETDGAEEMLGLTVIEELKKGW